MWTTVVGAMRPTRGLRRRTLLGASVPSRQDGKLFLVLDRIALVMNFSCYLEFQIPVLGASGAGTRASVVLSPCAQVNVLAIMTGTTSVLLITNLVGTAIVRQ